MRKCKRLDTVVSNLLSGRTVILTETMANRVHERLPDKKFIVEYYNESKCKIKLNE